MTSEEWQRILKAGIDQWAGWISGYESWNQSDSFSWGFSKEKQNKKLFGKSQPSQSKDVHILPSSAPTEFWTVEIWGCLAMSRRLKWAWETELFYPHEPFWVGRSWSKSPSSGTITHEIKLRFIFRKSFSGKAHFPCAFPEKLFLKLRFIFRKSFSGKAQGKCGV